MPESLPYNPDAVARMLSQHHREFIDAIVRNIDMTEAIRRAAGSDEVLAMVSRISADCPPDYANLAVSLAVGSLTGVLEDHFRHASWRPLADLSESTVSVAEVGE